MKIPCENGTKTAATRMEILGHERSVFRMGKRARDMNMTASPMVPKHVTPSKSIIFILRK